MNLYAYVGNDPINLTDPTGKYGRGSGFTEKEWERFDAKQQQAAERMERGAVRLEKLGDKMDKKEAGSGQKARDMAGQLRDGSEVLRSDGFDGHIVNAVDQSTYEQMGGGKDGAAFVKGKGPVMTVNRDNAAVFGKDASVPLGFVLGHEALHSVGLSDQTGPNGAKAYKYGLPPQKKAFKAVTGTNDEAINPDHIMDWAY